ncbi:MAG: rhodanese-like domain-containing protein [Bacteroidota bacterium]
MHYITILCVLVIGLAMACQSSNSPATVEQTVETTVTTKSDKSSKRAKALPPKQFAAKMASVSVPQLVDVRTNEEYRAGFIDNALNIDFYSSNFAQLVQAQLDKKRPVFVYCKAGGRSGKTAAMLSNLGYQEVYDLQGGYSAWVRSSRYQLPKNIQIEEQ